MLRKCEDDWVKKTSCINFLRGSWECHNLRCTFIPVFVLNHLQFAILCSNGIKFVDLIEVF